MGGFVKKARKTPISNIKRLSAQEIFKMIRSKPYHIQNDFFSHFFHQHGKRENLVENKEDQVAVKVL